MTVRVLVVDDEPDVEVLFRQQFRREVREGHYTIDFALSGEAALKKARWAGRWRDRPTGVGHQHAGQERRPDLPVFMISAYGDAGRVVTALARGADQFLAKPVDFPKLKQDIKAVM